VKIYTRTGDRGDTGLIDGSRVSKDDPRVDAYGEIDELNAVIGLVVAHSPDGALKRQLQDVQRELFALGAQLADPQARIAERRAKAAVTHEHVGRLEAAIDEHDAALPPLTAFILPGGSPLGAWLHLARTVCRRAERAVVSLDREQALDPNVVSYLNRLSDLLFVLARRVNQDAGVPEQKW
jgi:cob(I)alamin adenosyltransferase